MAPVSLPFPFLYPAFARRLLNQHQARAGFTFTQLPWQQPRPSRSFSSSAPSFQYGALDSSVGAAGTPHPHSLSLVPFVHNRFLSSSHSARSDLRGRYGIANENPLGSKAADAGRETEDLEDGERHHDGTLTTGTAGQQNEEANEGERGIILLRDSQSDQTGYPAIDDLVSAGGSSDRNNGSKGGTDVSGSPYGHNFDSWVFARNLRESGFTETQSIIIMHATRVTLGENLERARKQFVSQSQVQNDAYLFGAACSELRNEINSSRRIEIEKQRSQQAQLEHEIEVLSQKVTHELNRLREEVKGLFDDHKMSVGMDQHDLDSRITEMGHRISIGLNAVARTEIETLRWLLIRRGATALAIAVVFILGALQFYRTHRPKPSGAAPAVADAPAAAPVAVPPSEITDDFTEKLVGAG